MVYLDSSDSATGEYFKCWHKFFPATERNYWGGLESAPVTQHANGVDGSETQMYVVVVVPDVDDEVTSGGKVPGGKIEFTITIHRRLLSSRRVSGGMTGRGVNERCV